MRWEIPVIAIIMSNITRKNLIKTTIKLSKKARPLNKQKIELLDEILHKININKKKMNLKRQMKDCQKRKEIYIKTFRKKLFLRLH